VITLTAFIPSFIPTILVLIILTRACSYPKQNIWRRWWRAVEQWQMHWLRVHQRIKFKTAVLVYKSLHGLAPQYLVQDCELVAAADRRQLRSSDIATFVVPRTYTRLGDRTFPVAGPQLWNSLPSNLRQSDLTLQQFRRTLKTYLFGWRRLQHLVILFVVCYTNVLNSLLTDYTECWNHTAKQCKCG